MGSYASLRIGDLIIGSTKNDVDPTLMMLFTEGEKKISKANMDDLVRLYGSCEEVAEQFGISSPDDLTDVSEIGDGSAIQIVEYVIGLREAKDRLEFMGFTLPCCQKNFDEGVREELRNLALRKEIVPWNAEILRQAMGAVPLIRRLCGFLVYFRVGVAVGRHFDVLESG